MIKYLGSKRTLVGVLGEIATRVEARNAVDLFTGTTRVAQELKSRGVSVTAADIATYSAILSDCYIATDSQSLDEQTLDNEIKRLNELPGEPGYFTETFCEKSRFFQPKNGARVDAIRNLLERDYRDSPLFPILMTSLMLAADRVDSTTGVQMAYLKKWAPRAYNDLELRRPNLLPGSGSTILGDVFDTVSRLPRADMMYLDPPYNQHRYFTNYHIWETLVRWDNPDCYGIACKRVDSKDPSTKSIFNKKREMPPALSKLLTQVDAEIVVVSYNDESWITAEEMMRSLRDAGHQDVRMLAFDRKRYVGAQIGIYNPSGVKVGKVERLRNVEYIFIAGPTEKVDAAVRAAHASPKRVEDAVLF